MTREYRIFISHSWDHDDVLQDLKNLIDSHGYFPATYTQIKKDCSVDSDKAGMIKANIIKRLQESDVLLAISGAFGLHSEWIQWEMDKAKELGLKVIGVIPRDQQYISHEVFNRSAVDVRWNADSIVDAIRNYSR